MPVSLCFMFSIFSFSVLSNVSQLASICNDYFLHDLKICSELSSYYPVLGVVINIYEADLKSLSEILVNLI